MTLNSALYYCQRISIIELITPASPLLLSVLENHEVYFLVRDLNKWI
jgi:hypothetical protein